MTLQHTPSAERKSNSLSLGASGTTLHNCIKGDPFPPGAGEAAVECCSSSEPPSRKGTGMYWSQQGATKMLKCLELVS